jgi:hypothetical protein
MSIEEVEEERRTEQEAWANIFERLAEKPIYMEKKRFVHTHYDRARDDPPWLDDQRTPVIRITFNDLYFEEGLIHELIQDLVDEEILHVPKVRKSRRPRTPKRRQTY